MNKDQLLIDITSMQRVGGQLGSNPAGIFRDNNGEDYYVKSLESPMHARNEWVAAQLYQLAGAPVFSYVRCKDPCQIATRWKTLEKKDIAHLTEDERRQAQQWLAVHAWTANWDAAGYLGDNQGVAGGTVLTLDVGGALAFRAQGDPKGKAFGTCVNELTTLRTDPDNPHALKIFADISRDDLHRSVRIVTELPDNEIISTIIENGGSKKLADKMIARKANMADQLASLI